jgi:hypothetical protein
MTRLPTDELRKVREWLEEKKIDKCPLCGETHPFGDVTELGVAREASSEQDQGHMPEKAGHVDLLVLLTYSATGAVGRNSNYP